MTTLTGLPEDAKTVGAERLRLMAASFFTQWLGVGFLTIGLVSILREGGTSLATRYGSRRHGHYRSWLIPLQLGLVLIGAVLGAQHQQRYAPA